jgi:cytochrome b subunit of formate dehydrogenase
MRSKKEIKRYSKIVVVEHWLMMIFLVPLALTGLFLVRDWFVHEFHIHGAENYLPTLEVTSDFHLYAAFGLVFVGAIHLAVHAGQKEKPILPKNTMVELKSALYSLLFLVFLTKKQERGSGGKYKKSQRIFYAFTIYVLGLGAISGFLLWAGILEEQMIVAHVVAGVMVLLVGVHRIALAIRNHDKVAIRSIGFTGTMPEWYVKKNHRAWYQEIVGRNVSESQKPSEPRIETKGQSKDESMEKPSKKTQQDKETQIIGEEIPNAHS